MPKIPFVPLLRDAMIPISLRSPGEEGFVLVKDRRDVLLIRADGPDLRFQHFRQCDFSKNPANLTSTKKYREILTLNSKISPFAYILNSARPNH